MTREEQIFAYRELRENGQAFFVDNYEDADRIIEALEKMQGREDALAHCEKCEIEQWDAIYRTEEKERAKVLDELLERLDFSFDGLISESTVRDTIAELKGKSNELY